MDFVCPVCNNLTTITEKCVHCGVVLENKGLLQDYFGSYSPYLDQGIFETGYKGMSLNNCVHVCACPKCSSIYIVEVTRLAL